jgi:tripartite-type tricarboxylate transporter receptor subunit TctC
MTRVISRALMLCAAVAAPVLAQNDPTRPITLLVPFAAGGPTDTVARQLARVMGKGLNQTIVVENAAGAGGTIAATRLKNAAPAGYTLLIAHIGMSTAPALYRKLPWDPLVDFETIGQVVDVPMTVIARKDLPPNNFKELVAYMKANKDKVTLANAGLGAASHLCGLLLMSAIETEVTTVPYKGTAPALDDLLDGQVDAMCDQTTQTTSHVRSNRVKAYGVTSRTTVPSLPGLAPLAEQGLPNFEVVVWHGIYAPKGTPGPIVDRLVTALQASLADPGFVQRMVELGAQVVSKEKATPGGLRTHLGAEIDRWTPIIRKAGVHAE